MSVEPSPETWDIPEPLASPTPDEIAANARTYETQIYKILDPDRTRIDFNSRWMTALGAAGLIELAARYTVARMLERDDFEKRYKGGMGGGVNAGGIS